MKIGFWELMLIFVVALVVIGPDKLPYYAKKFGQALQSLRETSNELTQDLQKSVVEPLAEAQRPLQEAVQPLADLTNEVNSNLRGLEKSVRDLGHPLPPAAPTPETAAPQGTDSTPATVPPQEAAMPQGTEAVPAAAQSQAAAATVPADAGTAAPAP